MEASRERTVQTVGLLNAARPQIGWQEWSEAALDEAREKRRPVLLDISAVWCHWCHVMEETTYGNEEVVALINDEFVAIKVDNDMRPDINARYNMGGWPTTVFLTPSGDVLAGATYLNAEQMIDALQKVAHYYRTHQMDIASQILQARRNSGGGAARSVGTLDDKLIQGITEVIGTAYDPVYGGFGKAPKFPHAEALNFLLEQAQIWGENDLREMVLQSLEQMTTGGLYDAVEDGFFRYATKQDWSEVHYEKMLEDNAALVSVLAKAGLSARAEKTIRYLENNLRNPESKLYGGSQDASEEYYQLNEAERKTRVAPAVDRRVYTAWNAALVVAYLETAAYTKQEGLREQAGSMLEELLARRYRVNDGWERTEGIGGQLVDQVWGLLACLRAYQWNLGEQWLEAAKIMAEEMETKYGDRELGGYFDIAQVGAGRLQERMKPLAENAIAAMALSEMEVLLGEGEEKYQQRAKRALESVAAVVGSNGLVAAIFARALARLKSRVKVITSNQNLAEAAIRAHPYVVIDPKGDERAVICVGQTCLAAVQQAAEVEGLLEGILVTNRAGGVR